MKMYIILLLLTPAFVYCYGGNSNHVSGSAAVIPNNDHIQGSGPLRNVYSWIKMDFTYPTQLSKLDAIRKGIFNTSRIIPIGVAAAGQRVFITMPKWYEFGTPATIATTTLQSANTNSPSLMPYPDWSWHSQGDCQGITSVFRVKIDECNRMWVLDTGRVNTFVNAKQICPPQVHVFDLGNDLRILRYPIPNSALKDESLLVSIEVEYPNGQCSGRNGVDKATLYIADPTTFALIVIDLSKNSAYRIQDKTMYPSPEGGTFTVNGESFEFMDGIVGLGLSPRNNQAERTLYFHPMTSYREFWVKTKDLKSLQLASNPRIYQGTSNVRTSQSAGSSMDQNGVLFFGLVTENSLACWNSRKPYTKENIGIVAHNDKTMQFISTATVDPDGRLWAISMRFQSVLAGTLSESEPNYRIFMAPSSANVIRGTACARGGGGHPGGNNRPTSSGGQQQQQLIFKP